MEERFGFIHDKLDIKLLILYVLRHQIRSRVRSWSYRTSWTHRTSQTSSRGESLEGIRRERLGMLHGLQERRTGMQRPKPCR